MDRVGVVLVLVLVLGLAACDRPPLPKTGERVEGKGQVPPVTTEAQPRPDPEGR